MRTQNKLICIRSTKSSIWYTVSKTDDDDDDDIIMVASLHLRLPHAHSIEQVNCGIMVSLPLRWAWNKCGHFLHPLDLLPIANRKRLGYVHLCSNLTGRLWTNRYCGT